VRVRVDGAVHEIDAVPKLAKTTKHTIEVVVDRLRVSPEFATPRRVVRDRAAHGDGRAIAVETGNECAGAGAPFSSKFACPICNYAPPSSSRGCSRSTRAVPALRRPRIDQLLRSQASSRFAALARVGRDQGWDRRNQFYFQSAVAREAAASTSSGRSRS
jgi:excinuclease ABC subunit A